MAASLVLTGMHVPTRVSWIVGVASAAIAGFLPIGEAAELTNIRILLAFVVHGGDHISAFALGLVVCCGYSYRGSVLAGR